jgi:predicted hydrocarbon binding protein
MDNSILADLAYSPDRGALEFREVRYLLIRPETLAGIQKAMESELGPASAAELLSAGGFTGGKLSGQRYRESLDLSEREAVEFMCQMGGEIGWGRFRLIELDEGSGRLVVEVDDSPFAISYGPGAADGVCHLIRGVLEGLAAALFATKVSGSESLCLAKGDAHCRFEIGPRQ